MELFVGIDWGSRTHSACVLCDQGQLKGEWEFEHTGDGISNCIDKLVAMAGGAEHLRVAIEVPHGAVVETLMERGIAVYSINPKQLDRFRDRHSVAGAKDDRLDAYVLADALRTDLARFRPVELSSATLVELRDMSRLYESLTGQVIGLSNQVVQQLQRYYVQLRDLGRWHEEAWLWDLFDAAPTPQKLETLRTSDVKAILKRHGIRRYKPLPLLEALQGRESLTVAPGVTQGASSHIALLLPILRTTHQQRKRCEKQLQRLLKRPPEPSAEPEDEKTHRDAELLLSLPGLGVHTGATMLAEASLALRRRDYQDLRRLCGAAPVSKRTGGRRKKPTVVMRRACSRRLRNALHHWAGIASRYDPVTGEHYARLRAKGHSHGRAVRGVGDRLLKMLISILSSGRRYDPSIRNRRERKPVRETDERQRWVTAGGGPPSSVERRPSSAG